MKCLLLFRSTLFLFAFATTAAITAQPVVIPTVFHILNEGGYENISDQQVLDAVRILNNNYGKQLPDTNDVAAPFRAIVANMNIEFRLANIDPNGNCTNGIEHVFTTSSVYASGYLKTPDWPRDKYLNIWVTGNLCCGAAAYTYYPWLVDTLPEYDGLVILSDYVGSIGTGQALTSHSLTYETGKYFGLINICAGGTNLPGFPIFCGDDSVADTPPCQDGFLFCSADSSCGAVDNWQNFMSTSYCGSMFTNGQKARVMEYLNRSTAQRNNLWAEPNLISTGTANPNQTPCAPVCDFFVNNPFVCLGQQVTFFDASYNGDLTGRTWAFANNSSTTSTDSAVTIKYTSPGWQTVTLSVMNDKGSSIKAQTLVYVADPNAPVTPTPYYTGFDDAADFNHNWVAINPDNDAPHFQQVNSNGLSTVLLNNFNATEDGTYDDLYTPAFDCSNLHNDSALLSFRYSLATRDEDAGPFYTPDSLVVYANLNCSYVWTKIYSKGSANFINAGSNSSFFGPGSNSTLWNKISIPLTSQYLQPDVRFKMRVFGAHNSNNFYLDDFVVGYETTGIREEKLNNIAIVPNPFTNYVSVNGLPTGKFEMTVYDVTGRLMYNETISGGENKRINMNIITASGIYFMKITGQDGSGTFKLVKD